ncbi:MAG: hypothetical protein IPJ13_23200 [Saprospiraceae bacterium]|nr:hypothetical protein [Saprospiraceae bacterium]
MVETKLKDDNVFETQLNNYFKKITFTMPEIQHNSVLEYEYELESEYYTNINDWILQSEYPVVYNEFYTSMPQYYNYQINITGPLPHYQTSTILMMKTFILGQAPAI